MKLLVIASLFAVFLALVVACGSDDPTDVANHQSADEIEKAAQELFANWLEATQNRDAATFHSLVAADVRDRCTIEQLDQFFTNDNDAFTYPEMHVKEVFLAAGNSEEAFMTMELRNEPRTGRDGAIDAYVASVPYPIVREDGKWRMVIQGIYSGDDCPFFGETSTQEAVPAGGSTPRPPRP